MAIMKPSLDAGVGSGGKTNSYTLAGGITSAQDAEIKRKALAGIALVNPTAEKNALYEQYKPKQSPTASIQPINSPVGQSTTPFDQNAFAQQMMNQQKSFLDNIYNQQKEAQLGQIRAQRDKAVGQINQQKSQIAPQYQGVRNQTDVTNQQNVQKLREVMAANGLNATGENVSATASMNNERVNSLNKLNLQERETMNDLDRRISDLNNPAEENAMIAALEAERSRSMYDAYNRSQDVGYSRYRDSVGDSRYEDEKTYGRGRDAVMDNRYVDERDYGRGRDAIGDQRYTNEWNYNVGRDKVADGRYDKEWNYNVGRDKIADGRYNDETQYNRGQDQKQWDYQAGRDKVSDGQWNQTYNRGVFESDRSYNSRGSSGGSGGKSTGITMTGSIGAVLSPEQVLQQLLGGMDYETFVKMRENSLKADPKATTGVTAQPGSYWWGRGYGSQYLPK
jgi:hypothetical protein